jgi:hypothetical protein
MEWPLYFVNNFQQGTVLNTCHYLDDFLIDVNYLFVACWLSSVGGCIWQDENKQGILILASKYVWNNYMHGKT